ncbi:MAG: hypothetical protein QOC76_1159 [Mycobacterium sp.]|jgi:hypothetical protein|nr:hypothetical protein [Mycobacterium sp.]
MFARNTPGICVQARTLAQTCRPSAVPDIAKVIDLLRA